MSKRRPTDPGLAQIDEWHRAYAEFNAERLRSWPDDHLLAAERATVAARGHAIPTTSATTAALMQAVLEPLGWVFSLNRQGNSPW
jgi:hypothetical protein